MKDKTEQLVPLMRTDGLVTQPLGDEILVYDRHRHQAHSLSRSAAIVWNHCDGKTTVAEICELMTTEFETPMAEQIVLLGLAQLRKARLLEEPLTLSSSPVSAISRREAIRRVGLAAAAALPVVTSIVAPKAAQAANCTPNGQSCNGNGNCCSQSCVGNICV
ncbi:MAG: PqqD family peptide modification chaperone [Acidobacteriota bacterium]